MRRLAALSARLGLCWITACSAQNPAIPNSTGEIPLHDYVVIEFASKLEEDYHRFKNSSCGEGDVSKIFSANRGCENHH